MSDALRASEFSASKPDASLLPRTYPTSTGNRIFLTLVACVNAAGGLLGMVYFGLGHEMKSPGQRLFFVLLSFVFVALGAYVLVYTFKSKIILYADRIEWQGIKSFRSLRRDDIAGWRIIRTQYMSTLEVRPRSLGMKKLKVGLMLERDEVFDAWLAGLPNLDAREQAESLARVVEDQSVAATPEERSQKLAKAKKTATALAWAAGIAAVWGWLYPQPYETAMAILVVIPAIAVVLLATGKGLYQMEGRRHDARADLFLPFIVPGAVLALRSLWDFEFLKWTPILKMAIVASMILTILVVGADRGMRERRWAFLAFLFLCFFYAFGAMAQANALLDRSEGQVFRTLVLAKRISTGKSTAYYFMVEPWGPRREPNEVSVSRVLYQTTPVGQNVCVSLWKGALGAPWFVVRTCQ